MMHGATPSSRGSGQTHERCTTKRFAFAGAWRMRVVENVDMVISLRSRPLAIRVLSRSARAAHLRDRDQMKPGGCGRRGMRSSGHRSGDLLQEVEELLARHCGELGEEPRL